MPTPILIDGFEHQRQSEIDPAFGTDTESLVYWHQGGGVTWPAGRNGVCQQHAAAGSQSYIQKHFAGTVVLVGSFYWRCTVAPSNLSILADFGGARFYLMNGGQISLQIAGAGTVNSATGSSLNTGAWHLMDFKMDKTTTTYRIDWQIDGVSQTAITTAGTAGVLQGSMGLGESSAGVTATCAFDDLVLSGTGADYPLGAHDVLYTVPTGDGTHSSAANVIETNAGTDIVPGYTTAYQLMDEWPANTSDYVMQSAIASGSYAEVTFSDAPSGKDIWGVEAVAALFSSGANANNGTARIVDSSGNTLTNIFSGDISDTNLHFQRAIIADPAGNGWSTGDFDGLKARVGFSTDVTDVPRWSALMLQYAIAPMSAMTVGFINLGL